MRELLHVDLLIETRPTQSRLKDFRLDVTGPLDAISDAIRVLAWALSVFRKAKGEQLSLFSAQVNLQEQAWDAAPADLVIDIEELSHTDPTTKNGTCWHGIFHDVAVATSFPIPPRSGEQGIELPFNLMSLLARVEYPLQHGSGFILKGQHSALIPTFISQDGNDDHPKVQWHLKQSSKDSDLPMDEVPFPTIHDDTNGLNIGTIMSDSSRHYLGLYDDAEINFGTEASQSQRFCKYELPKDVKVQRQRFYCNWQRSISLTGGVSIIGLFTLGVSMPFVPTLPKTLTVKLQVVSTLSELADHASKELALVYDTKNKLAWLLPEICVILQLMQTYAASNPGMLWSIGNVDSSVTDRTEACRKLILGLSEEPQQVFRRFCDFFRQMKEEIYREHRILYHRYSKKQLSGVGFAELAEITQPADIPLLKSNIDSERAGCWVAMLKANWEQSRQLAKEGGRPPPGLKVMALFCNGLSSAPIRHRTQSCHVWSPAPEGHDYLITTIECVKRLTEAQGGERGKLSPKHWWHIGEREPFDFGLCRRQEPCGNCNRLQKLAKTAPHHDLRTLGRILDDESKNNGAIVFGEKFWVPQNLRHEPCGVRPGPPVNSCGSLLNLWTLIFLGLAAVWISLLTK